MLGSSFSADNRARGFSLPRITACPGLTRPDATSSQSSQLVRSVTSAFSVLPAYTRRTNPWYYSDIRGPKFFNIDGTLTKDFHVTERIRFQLHMDAFNAIIVSPQAAILAVGRIAERVVPMGGTPAVQPMLTLTLSCDHRAVDGARGAQFLGALAAVIEDPLALLH